MSTRTGTWISGAAMRWRSSAAPPASPKCRRPQRCCGACELFLLQRAVGNDGALLDAAEPAHREIVALPRHGNGAVRAAAAFFGLALGDDLDEEHVGFRLPDAGELARAVEVRILGLRAFGANGELELVGRRAADLRQRAAPIAGDVGARDRGGFLVFRGAGERRSVLG